MKLIEHLSVAFPVVLPPLPLFLLFIYFWLTIFAFRATFPRLIDGVHTRGRGAICNPTAGDTVAVTRAVLTLCGLGNKHTRRWATAVFAPHKRGRRLAVIPCWALRLHTNIPSSNSSVVEGKTGEKLDIFILIQAEWNCGCEPFAQSYILKKTGSSSSQELCGNTTSGDTFNPELLLTGALFCICLP